MGICEFCNSMNYGTKNFARARAASFVLVYCSLVFLSHLFIESNGERVEKIHYLTCLLYSEYTVPISTRTRPLWIYIHAGSSSSYVMRIQRMLNNQISFGVCDCVSGRMDNESGNMGEKTLILFPIWNKIFYNDSI